jgi:hypothetical protein
MLLQWCLRLASSTAVVAVPGFTVTHYQLPRNGVKGGSALGSTAQRTLDAVQRPTQSKMAEGAAFDALSHDKQRGITDTNADRSALCG